MDKVYAKKLFTLEGNKTAKESLIDLALLGKRAATASYFNDEIGFNKNCKRAKVYKWLKKTSEVKQNEAFFSAFENETDRLETYYG